MNMFVGNLVSAVTDDDLRPAFGALGQVSSTAIIKDRDTGQSRGFGFAERANDAEARTALAALDRKDLKGKALRVSEAHGKGGGARGGGAAG